MKNRPNSVKPGLHRDIPMESYIADPCPLPSLSKSVIHQMLAQSPAHARYNHPRLNPNCPKEESSRADLGSAIHSAILGGADIVYAPTEFEDWRKKEAQTFRDDARAKGKLALLARQEAGINVARDSARAFLKHLPGWSDKFETEGTMLWQEGKTWKRARYDLWLPSCRMMVDVKTCESADPARWIRTSLLGGGYDIQAEHYLDGARAIRLSDTNLEFLFLLVEIEPPYCCSFVGLDPAYTDLAKRKIKHATALWERCLQRNEWPGYSHFPHWATPPAWAEGDVADRMSYAEESHE